MALHYVDNSLSTGANDGSSWVNAWHSLSSMTGLAAGDTVYISGGPNGSSQTYSFVGGFGDIAGYTEGTAGNPITYKIGQDASHNGTVIFNQTSVGFSNNAFLNGGNNVVFSGDAGDGVKHFKVSGTIQVLIILQGTNVGVRMSYWDLQTLHNIGSINPGNKIEIDHINIIVGNDLAADRAMYGNFGGSTWDDNLFHDCIIALPYNPSNNNAGPDGLQFSGTGFSIYNNIIFSYIDNNLTSTQHMDGWQGGGTTSFVKIYNNIICNMTNYGLYAEAPSAAYNHLWIYNNFISLTDPVLAAGSSGGIVVELKAAGTMNDIAVMNNTIVDLEAPGSRTLTMLSHANGTYTNSIITNNILVNGNPIEQDSGTPTPNNNVSVTAANASSYFKTYSALAGRSNDVHLTALATSLIGQGTNLSSYFTVDLAGSSRPGAGNWDIGAYIYAISVIAGKAGRGIVGPNRSFSMNGFR